MTSLIKMDGEYANWIKDLSLRFKQSQIKASIKVNSEMLKYYYSLGADIVNKKAESRWGDGFFKNLSRDLQESLPGIKGLSETNLKYAKCFYLLYNQDYVISPQVVDQIDSINDDELNIPSHILNIPWGHHRFIIDKCKNNTQEIIKDPYCFDFASLSERYNEKELKDALINNIEKFLIELGKGFAYMGREYRIEVGNSELFADMLFYNTILHCYVVVEVKTQKFENSFLGQLSGYVSCANHVLKRELDNPTIGLLICKNKDDVMAHYSLEGYNNPLGISEYELSKLFPNDYRTTLPSIEDIEKEIGS